jgi:hypothetical protein
VQHTATFHASWKTKLIETPIVFVLLNLLIARDIGIRMRQGLVTGLDRDCDKRAYTAQSRAECRSRLVPAQVARVSYMSNRPVRERMQLGLDSGSQIRLGVAK